MKLTPANQISLHDELNSRIHKSVRHLQELNTPEMRMEFTHPDEFWHWGADYLGRWIAALGLLSSYTRGSYGVRDAVDELIAFQNADGSFGPYTNPHDFQEWFGMGRGLIGLLEYYEVDPDPIVLESAVRLGRYYSEWYPNQSECMYECYSNGLEGIVRLFSLTKEPEFLATARRMAETSVVYEGIRYSMEVASNGRRIPCAGQVHCQLSTARGLLDLFEQTQEDQYLQPVLSIHSYIQSELMWITGGLGFYYFRPEENETCADADWFRLNLQLWRITGDVQYMHLAEKILLNQLYFNQADNGGFCYLRGLQNRAGATFDACCSHHGPRALYDALCYIYTTDASGLWINLYTTGDARISLDQGSIRIQTAVERRKDSLRFSFEMTDSLDQPFTIHFRNPEWMTGSAVRVNEQDVECTVENGYTTISRQWESGDRVEIVFGYRIEIHQGERIGDRVIYPGSAAVSYGPQVFCLNDYWNPQTRVHFARLRTSSRSVAVFSSNLSRSN